MIIVADIGIHRWRLRWPAQLRRRAENNGRFRASGVQIDPNIQYNRLGFCTNDEGVERRSRICRTLQWEASGRLDIDKRLKY